MAGNDNSYEDEKVLAYDLRQEYAKLVGQHMIDISEKRKSGDFYNWFLSIEDLKTMVGFKFKNGDEDEKEYNKKRGEIIVLANQYMEAWTNKSSNPKEALIIEMALRSLEEFLYAKMNDSSMFGGKFSDEDSL